MTKIKMKSKNDVKNKSGKRKRRHDKAKPKDKDLREAPKKAKTREERQRRLRDSFPTLGREILTCTKEHGEGKKSEKWLRLKPSWKTRFAMAGMAFVQGMLFAVMALVVLYLPDYVFDYGHREENFLLFFAKFLGIAILCIALAASLSTFIRETVVFIDLQRNRLLDARRLNARSIRERSISFGDISRVNLRASTGRFRRSRLFLEFNKREPLLIAESRGSDDDLIALRDWWTDFVLPPQKTK